MSDDGARFCRDCGRSLGEPDVDLLVVGVEAGEAGGGTEAVVRRGQTVNRFWLPLLGVVVVFVAGWGIWAAVAQATGEPADPETASDENQQEPQLREDDGGVDTSSTIADRVDEPGASDAPTTAEADEEAEVEVETGPADPLLGRDVPYDLLIGAGNRLVVVDLDTGEVHEPQASPAVPAAVSGDWLVVYDRSPSQSSSGSSLARLPLDDLAAEPVPLLDLAANDQLLEILPVPDPDSGQLWVRVIRDVDIGYHSTEFLTVDLSSGETIEHPWADEVNSLGIYFGGYFPDANGGLISQSAGGVYAATGRGFQRVAEGRLLAADRDRALVESCDERMRCTRTWFDRVSWQPLDLTAPGGDVVAAMLVPGTDWLFMPIGGGADNKPVLLNIETGQTVTLDSGRYVQFTGSTEAPPISPDGEWVASLDGFQTIELRNLISGETTKVAMGATLEGPMFFVDE